MITVGEFKGKLRDKAISDIDIVQRYIIYGSAFVFKDDDDKYFKLKKMIAQKFGLSSHDVIMVGSAKMGFRLGRSPLWKPFDDDSDIDMTIVSSNIFRKFWKDLHDFNINLKARTDSEDKQFRSFLDYFFKGWLRPDRFPFSYPGRKEWLDFFKSISYGEFGAHNKISGAIFYDWDFFEAYQTSNIRKIRVGGVA